MFAALIPLLTALAPLGQTLLAGTSVEAALAGFGVTNWLAVATAIAPLIDSGAGPNLGQLLQVLQQLQPHLNALAGKVDQYGPQQAAQMMPALYAMTTPGDVAIQMQEQRYKEDH